MNENILVHYGIKGMKWGIRRYQNADGSLTAAGRQHYNVGKARKEYPSEEEMQKVVKRKSLEKAYDKATEPDLSVVNQATNQTKNVLNKSQDAYREYKKSKQPSIDVSNMTNRELQEAITRMNLENQYTDLMRKKQNIKQGKDYVDSAFEVAKTVAELAGLGLTVYSLVKKVS